jgi:hypothetical protein
MGGTCSAHGNLKNAYKILVRKPEGKRQIADEKPILIQNFGWEA